MLTPSRALHQLRFCVKAVTVPFCPAGRETTLHGDGQPAKEPIGRRVRILLVALLHASLLVGGALSPGGVEAQGLGPPTPHSTDGREACTQCHGAAGPLAMPANHQGRTDGTCLLCHAAAAPIPTPTPAPPPFGTGFCLTCHGVPGLTMNLPNGDTVSLAVSADVFAQSVHGELLTCQACHPGHQQGYTQRLTWTATGNTPLPPTRCARGATLSTTPRPWTASISRC